MTKRNLVTLTLAIAVFIGSILMTPQIALAQTTKTAKSETIIGIVVRIVNDSNIANSESESWYMLQTAKRFYYLDGDNEDFSAAEGQLVKIQGVNDGNRISVREMDFTPKETRSFGEFPQGQNEFDSESKRFPAQVSNFLGVPASTMGIRSVYIVNVNFQNDPSTPATAEMINTAVFTGSYSANNFFQEASFYKFGISGTVHPN